ncbi:MAG: hypothetical protein PHG91_04405 [Syntrophales bacterium]|jgi:hypothetical protein|nr:hypothetical protein [Syntrophales bacterium]MDD5232617.1 hypothetical protein [Syntrophales bacterium]MDD5533469.1 hypothetical protein [Syntrophales bacterium]HPL62167.1 hypothetical protein [Syntrophales bacterium]
MKVCHACRKEITDLFTGRRDACPACGRDLRCCLNCVFFAQGFSNNCREPQAERVADKEKSNFCDFFRFRDSSPAGEKPGSDARKKLEDLFKK